MTTADLELWLERYGRAWVDRDPDAALGLFSADARYHETPFDPPVEGHAGIRRYWQRVPETQEDIHFEASALAVADGKCIARWQAAFTRIATGARIELDGVFVLTFDDRGVCTELREWWHRRESSSQP